jgi:hypothetical protein
MARDRSAAAEHRSDEPVQKVVHFVVHGEDLTRIARVFWADEHEPARALRLLLEGLQGINLLQAVDVLTGRSKLVGDSHRGVHLARDRAAKSPHGSPFPSVVEAFERERKRSETAERDSRDAIALLGHDTVMMGSPDGRREVSRVTAHELKTKRITWNDVRVYRNLSYMEACLSRQDETGGPPPVHAVPVPDGETPAGSDVVDNPWGPDPNEPPPESFSTVTQDTGWLSPEGRFYPCSYYGHDLVAHRLGKGRYELDRLGWVVLSGSNGIHKGDIEVTQAQRDRVFDWCTSQNKGLPYWMRPEFSEGL